LGKVEYALGSRSDIVHRAEDSEGWSDYVRKMSEGAKGKNGERNGPGASSRREEGGNDGGDGGDGGGREELLSYYRTGGRRHGSLASRSGVTNLSSHNYYCTQLFISWLLSPRLSSLPS
jgi:hypothetical protein